MKKILLLTLPLLFSHVYAAESSHELSKQEEREAKSSEFRLRAIKEFAIQKGLIDGRRFRFNEIARDLNAQKPALDVIYSVDKLYIRTEGGLFQVPVIITGNDLYQMDNNGKSYDWSKVRYETIADGRFVTSQLDWFTYLVNADDLNQVGPADDPILKPRNSLESTTFETYYKNAYAEGINQANIEMDARVTSLTTIKKGMINYHDLVALKILEPVQLSSSYIPVSGNNTTLTLSTISSTVSKEAKFNHNPDDYKLTLIK